MAYNFVTIKSSNVQKENAYILYMILSSYFHKCICRSKITEENLFLYYKNMSTGKQEKRESQIINAVGRAIGKKEQSLADLNCEFWILIENGQYRLIFKTWFEEVTAIVNKDGKYQIKVA